MAAPADLLSFNSSVRRFGARSEGSREDQRSREESSGTGKETSYHGPLANARGSVGRAAREPRLSLRVCCCGSWNRSWCCYGAASRCCGDASSCENDGRSWRAWLCYRCFRRCGDCQKPTKLRLSVARWSGRGREKLSCLSSGRREGKIAGGDGHYLTFSERGPPQ